MKIGTKLVLAFLAVTLTLAAIGYYALTALQDASLQAIASDLENQAALAMSEIDEEVWHRIKELQWYAEKIS